MGAAQPELRFRSTRQGHSGSLNGRATVSRLLSSPRFRRRLLRWGSVAAAAGIVVFVGIRWANTADKLPKASGGPVQTVPPVPRTVRLTPAAQNQVRAIAEHFIQTAVYRRHLDEAWDLAAPGACARG